MNLNYKIYRQILNTVVLIIVFIFSIIQSTQAQTCSSTSRNSWEWPGHNNWFLATGGANGISYMLNQKTQTVTSVIQTDPCYNCNWDAFTTKIRGYQGVATASNDRGELVFFTNGRKAWDADGKLISDQILSGNECGSTEDMQSAAHGVMTVRHPLTPQKYYIISIDDIVSQGSPSVNNQAGNCGTGITFAAIDSSGVLIHSSEPIERDVPSGHIGAFRTTEDFAATLHANGVDIWITFHPLWQKHIVSYLLTCDGFVTAPVISGQDIVPYVGIVEGNGGLDFSQDGSKLGLGAEINLAGPNVDSKAGTGSVNLYDFDNKTGKISNRKAIYHKNNGTQNFYNLFFSANGNELHYGGSGGGGKYDVSSNNEATILAAGNQTSSTYVVGKGFSGYAMTAQGVLESSDQTFAKYPATSNNARFSSNSIYIPPLEEPDIEEVGPFCDTTQIVDLHTNWLCSGVSAEDTLFQRHLYTGPGIVDDKLGHFNPAVAGPGTHEIIFTYCGVDDTTYIDVVFCPACKATLKDEHPKFCAGNDLQLDTMIIFGTESRTWTIDSFPTNSGTAASLNINATDTMFDALSTTTMWGTYKLKMTATWGTETCYDTIYVTVDSLPIPDLGNDTSVCADWDSVTFDAGTYVSFDWGADGGDVQTITKLENKIFGVEVTDGNGCKGTDSVELTINVLPVADLGLDTAICDGDPAISFDASILSTSGIGITSYTWDDGANGSIKTTDVDGEYWVAIEDANGCSDTDSVVIVVHALPDVTLRPDTSICAGDLALEFIAFNGTTTDSTYTWSTGEVGTSIFADTAGTYQVVLEDAFGCLDSDIVVLSINALPVVDLGPDTAICGDADPVVFDAATTAPGLAYIWQDGTTITSDYTTKIEGDYWVHVTDVNQCSDSDTIFLKVNSFVPVNMGPDREICEGDSMVTLNAQIKDANWYVWAPTLETTQTIQTDIAGEYSVALEDSNGCKGWDTINVIVNTLPIVDLGNDTAICIGDPDVEFIAHGVTIGMTYSWSTGETTRTIDTADDDEYWVIIEDINGCSDSDTVVLKVNLLPIVDLGIDQEICQVDPDVTLDAANTSATYLWSTSETTQTIDINTDSDFSVIVTDTNGCIGKDTMNLKVNAMPVVSITDDVICAGDAAVTFDVAATFDTYLWSSGEATQSIDKDVAGEYSVIFTDANNCTGYDTVILVVNPLPTPDLGLDITMCSAAANTIFDAGTYASYDWSSGETSQTISKNVAATYTVEVTDANGCKGSDDVDLIVITEPTPAVLGPLEKCPGSSVTMNMSLFDNGNGPYTYAWHDGSTGSTYTTTAEENVWVDVTDQYGCTGRDQGSVTDKSNLTINIVAAPDVHLCQGESALLGTAFTSSGGYNFTWGGAGTGTTETLTATTSGIYDLHVDNGGGCQGDGSIEIFVHPYPVLTPTPAAICDGDAATIGDNLGGTFTYDWSTGETTAEISVTTQGTYNVEVTSDRGCMTDMDVLVTVNSNPTPDLGNDRTQCEGTSVTVSDLNAQVGQTHDWSTGETTVSISPTSDGTYTLTTTTAVGCVGTDDIIITFIPIPSVDLGPDIVICQGESVTLDAGSPGLDFQWNSGAATQTINVNQTGTYSVIVKQGGCSASDDVDVFVVELPTSALDQNLASQPYCFDELDRPITLSAGSNSSYDYLWGGGETTTEIEVNQAGTYVVTISAGNCSISDNITFIDYCPSTLYVPNTFTPDGDGTNDYFLSQGSYISNFKMLIYDRWGMLIFESDDINTGWDGTYMGNVVQIDVYVYKIYYDINQPDDVLKSEQKVGIVNVLK